MNNTLKQDTTPRKPQPLDVRHELLNGLNGLKNPPWQRMTTKDRLLHACLCAYRKHAVMNDDFGWDELATTLDDAIRDAIGDPDFTAWVSDDWDGDPWKE